MDSFIEYMVKRKKDTKAMVKTALIILAGILLSGVVFFLFLLLPPTFISFMPLAVAGIFYGVYRLVVAMDLEFEYCLTNGELDVDKITHRRSRKRLLSVHCKTFIEFGKVGEEGDENNGIVKTVDASANSKTYEDYYAIFYDNGQKCKLIFNPTAKMIEIFKIFAPRVVF